MAGGVVFLVTQLLAGFKSPFSRTCEIQVMFSAEGASAGAESVALERDPLPKCVHEHHLLAKVQNEKGNEQLSRCLNGLVPLISCLTT